MANKIVMLRLYGGEMVMGEVNPVQGDPGKVSLLNPRVFAVMPSFGGQVHAGFRPVSMFDKDLDKEVAVSSAQVWFETPSEKIPKEIVDRYFSEVSGINIASGADIAAVSGAKPGEFKL